METEEPSYGQRWPDTPSGAAALVARGRAHAESGELQEAERCYRQAAQDGDEEAHRLLDDLLDAEVIEAQEEASRGAASAPSGRAPARSAGPPPRHPDPAPPTAAPRPGPAASPERAGWWRRAAAIILDLLIASGVTGAWFVLVGGIYLAMGLIDAETGRVEPGTAEVVFWTAMGIGAFVAPLFPFAFIVRAGTHNGQSLGKQIMGIRVVRADARPVGWRTFWLRELLYRYLLITTIGGLVVLPVVLNYLWPLADREDRTWHDMLARTTVATTRS